MKSLYIASALIESFNMVFLFSHIELFAFRGVNNHECDSKQAASG